METERSMPRHTIYDFPLSVSPQVVHGGFAIRFGGDYVCAPAGGFIFEKS